jgi:hypothetical protein
MDFDWKKLFQIAGTVASRAAKLGVPIPFLGLAGELATGIDKLIDDVATKEGVTREQIIADLNVQGAANLLELAKDQAKGV